MSPWLKWGLARGRKLLFALMLMLIVAGLAQTLPADLALWLGGETLAYLDVVIGVTVVASMSRLRPFLDLVGYRASRAFRRLRARSRRRRTRRVAPPSADCDGRGLVFA